MKRLVIIFLIFNLLLLPLAAETIQIETSKGKTDLVIPDSQEELRKAYIEMSKLYVEERYAYENLMASLTEAEANFSKLQESIKKKDESISKYISDNEILRKQYNALTNDYNSLIEAMNKKNKVSPIKGILGVELGFKDQFTTMVPAVELGVYIFEKVMIKTRVSYPWEIGLGIGFSF